MIVNFHCHYYHRRNISHFMLMGILKDREWCQRLFNAFTTLLSKYKDQRVIRRESWDDVELRTVMLYTEEVESVSGYTNQWLCIWNTSVFLFRNIYIFIRWKKCYFSQDNISVTWQVRRRRPVMCCHCINYYNHSHEKILKKWHFTVEMCGLWFPHIWIPQFLPAPPPVSASSYRKKGSYHMK